MNMESYCSDVQEKKYRITICLAHFLCNLSHVLSVLPAGKHVGEGERLQASVDQV